MVFKTLENPWTGSESDKFVLLGYLDQLRKDPAFLSSEAVLPDLTDELAPVSIRGQKNGPSGGVGAARGAGQEQSQIHRTCLLGSVAPPGLSPLRPLPISSHRCFSSGGSTLLLTTSRTSGRPCFTVTGRMLQVSFSLSKPAWKL